MTLDRFQIRELQAADNLDSRLDLASIHLRL